jgi:hypothetical protein
MRRGPPRLSCSSGDETRQKLIELGAFAVRGVAIQGILW